MSETIEGENEPGNLRLYTQGGSLIACCSIRDVGSTDPTVFTVGETSGFSYTVGLGGRMYDQEVPASEDLDDAFRVLRGFVAICGPRSTTGRANSWPQTITLGTQTSAGAVVFHRGDPEVLALRADGPYVDGARVSVDTALAMFLEWALGAPEAS